LNNSESQANVHGPLTATTLVLTTYHSNPTDIISTQQWVEVKLNINQWTGFCHKIGSNGKTWSHCWLTQKTKKVVEEQKPQEEKGVENKEKEKEKRTKAIEERTKKRERNGLENFESKNFRDKVDLGKLPT
jgi:hypothetical protein